MHPLLCGQAGSAGKCGYVILYELDVMAPDLGFLLSCGYGGAFNSIILIMYVLHTH